MPKITLDHVRAALALPDFDVAAARRHMEIRPYPPRTAFPPGDDVRRAAVLVALFPAPASGDLSLLLIQRTPDPSVHSGQVAFPGGGWEPGDADDTATALREACEEVGLCAPVTVLGSLAQLFIPPSRFLVTPVVAYVEPCPPWIPNPREVDALLEFSLAALLDESTRQEEDWTLFGHVLRVPFYAVDGRKVWGATALMLSELEMRLRAAVSA